MLANTTHSMTSALSALLIPTVAAPLCNLGLLVLEAVAAVSAATSAKEVTVDRRPSGSCVVRNTRLDTVPPLGVYVVTKTLPLPSVAVLTAPGVMLENVTVAPAAFVVVRSVA